ncbi:SRPBCC domain-containing protein [Hydrogenophaga sp. 2FB]|uniref:SRPBCC family protein n=1 Tax=Hydrogenophaga sp. 2FB TaxID=2502187 RepID=UPI0010F965D8|nr:SRPBCC domain-containing protein [Hydrogenophaga sp. 2FB]
MIHIVHRVGIQAPLASVYRALATTEGVASWWTRETTGVSAPGGAIEVHFSSPTGERVGSMRFEVKALVPDREIRWHCTAGPEEWIGTDVVFRLSHAEPYSIVLFAHENWREASEFTAHCSMKWATFLLSLKALVETGEGKPSPHDLKIDNWN